MVTCIVAVPPSIDFTGRYDQGTVLNVAGNGVTVGVVVPAAL